MGNSMQVITLCFWDIPQTVGNGLVFHSDGAGIVVVIALKRISLRNEQLQLPCSC